MADAVSTQPDPTPAVAHASAAIEPHESGHVDELHDATHAFGPTDREFGKAVLAGYLGGFLVILAFIIVTLEVMADIPIGAEVAAGVAVAFWMGILGGVVAVGRWATKHEEEIHHA
jgi:hypothetical protein